jgi:hypothetical protein
LHVLPDQECPEKEQAAAFANILMQGKILKTTQNP